MKTTSASRSTRPTSRTTPPPPPPPRPQVVSQASSFTAAPSASPLVGLKRGGPATPAAVKQLQDGLIARGFLDPSVTSNPGYGKTFGPMTEAAVKKLQTASGLPATGVVDAATAAALAPPSGPVLVPPPPPAPTGPAGEIVKNEKLNAFLQANPTIKTVQQLVNATYPKGTWDKTCAELGLNPTELLQYRSASLKDWAVIPAPPSGSMPATPAEANAHFLNQYTTAFNPYYGKPNVSNNCGPASLAMCLRLEGKMPPGLNTEQQIDCARAQMYPAMAKTDGVTVKDANGNDVRLLDKDRMLTNIWAVSSAAGSQHQTGWASFDAALDSGKPVVVEGNIGTPWRTVFAAHHSDAPGTYAGGGDGHFIAVLGKTREGKYLVADPMYSGGTVAMGRDELAVFFARQGKEPSFTAV